MLGGTSFSAVKLTFLLWKQTGVEISFPLLVQHPTVRQIAAYILSQITKVMGEERGKKGERERREDPDRYSQVFWKTSPSPLYIHLCPKQDGRE
jgi:hypothetical protein